MYRYAIDKGTQTVLSFWNLHGLRIDNFVVCPIATYCSNFYVRHQIDPMIFASCAYIYSINLFKYQRKSCFNPVSRINCFQNLEIQFPVVKHMKHLHIVQHRIDCLTTVPSFFVGGQNANSKILKTAGRGLFFCSSSRASRVLKRTGTTRPTDGHADTC